MGVGMVLISSQEPAPKMITSVVVAVFICLGLVVTFFSQVMVAILTSPLYFIGSRSTFYHIQSFVWRGMNSFIAVGLNPCWNMRLHRVGKDDCLGNSSMGGIYFCNHRSNADPWFSAWALTRRGIEGRYVYKSSLKKIPGFGWCLRLAGDLDVAFGDKEQIHDMVERAKEVLRSGYNVLVFPEGTRSPSGLLQEFKPGFFKICCELGCAAIPMVMLGTESAWPLSGVKMGCATVHVGFGEPLFPKENGGVPALVSRMEQKMTDIAHEMLNVHEDSKENSAEVKLTQTDPFVTGLPYPWWEPPPELRDLSQENQLAILRSGKGHARGANLL